MRYAGSILGMADRPRDRFCLASADPFGGPGPLPAKGVQVGARHLPPTMKTLSSLLVVIALILAVIFLVQPGGVRLLGISSLLVCTALLFREYAGK